MRAIVRLVLIGSIALAGATAMSATPAQAGPPATFCHWGSQYYPHGWAGVLDGRLMECSYGVWHMM